MNNGLCRVPGMNRAQAVMQLAIREPSLFPAARAMHLIPQVAALRTRTAVVPDRDPERGVRPGWRAAGQVAP